MYCTINAAGNTLTKQFYRDEKNTLSKLVISSSAFCLSFSKGIIKIQVYSSVLEINQIDVIFVISNNYN